MASRKRELGSEPHLMTNETVSDSAGLRGSCVVSGSRARARVVVLELVRKEVEQHIKIVSGYVGLFVLISGLAALALRDDPLNSYLMSTSGFVILYLLPMQLGQWLIGNERLQRTIKFLKMLPLRAEHVVGAKFASAWLFITLSWLLACCLPWVIGIYMYKMTSIITFQFLFITYLLSVLSAGLCITMHLLTEKYATAFFAFAIIAVVSIAALVFTKVDFIRIYFTSGMVGSPFRQTVQLLVCTGLSLVIIVALYKLSVRGYRRISG